MAGVNQKEAAMADDDDKPNPPKPEDKPDDKPDGLGETGKKALDEERKARRDAERRARELTDRLKAIEDKDKSEVERLTEQVTTLTNQRDAAMTRADRLEVAVTKSLDEGQALRITSAAKRLTGSTREELEADADEFLAAFAAPDPRPAPVGKPREAFKPGNNDPDAPAEETDVRKLGERMFTR